MAKVSNRSTGTGNSSANMTIRVSEVWIDSETKTHFAKGTSIPGGKPIVVSQALREIKDKETDKTITDAFLKSRNHAHQTIGEDGEVVQTAGKIKLGENGIIQVMRGEWGAKVDGDTHVVIGPNSHVKVHFYNDQDIAEKGHEAALISASSKNVLMFNEGGLTAFEELPGVIQAGIEAHNANVENLMPVVAALPINDAGEVIGDEEIVYVPTWNKEEQRNLTTEESMKAFAEGLSSKLDVENTIYAFVVGESVGFNGGLDKRATGELATNRNYKYESEGEAMQAYVTFAKPGIAKIKFSSVEQDDGSEDKHYNSVNTVAFTGQSELLVNGLARVSGLEVNPEFATETQTQLDDFIAQNKAISIAARAEANAKKSEDSSTDELEGQMTGTGPNR